MGSRGQWTYWKLRWSGYYHPLRRCSLFGLWDAFWMKQDIKVCVWRYVVINLPQRTMHRWLWLRQINSYSKFPKTNDNEGDLINFEPYSSCTARSIFSTEQVAFCLLMTVTMFFKEPKSTFALDYNFARKKATSSSSSGGKSVAHIWELGDSEFDFIIVDLKFPRICWIFSNTLSMFDAI